MAAQASRARELPAVNDNVSFELGHVTSAQDTLESDELYGCGSPHIIGKVLLYGAYLTWRESWRRPTPRY
jgi:hypothetical protein